MLAVALVYSAFDLWRTAFMEAREAARTALLAEGELKFDIVNRHTWTYPYRDKRGRHVIVYGTIRSTGPTAVRVTDLRGMLDCTSLRGAVSLSSHPWFPDNAHFSLAFCSEPKDALTLARRETANCLERWNWLLCYLYAQTLLNFLSTPFLIAFLWRVMSSWSGAEARPDSYTCRFSDAF